MMALGILCAFAAAATTHAEASNRDALGRDPTTQIQHVVIISKENRSFDQYFGQFPGANGATTAVMHDGTVVPLAQTPDPMPNDIAHDLGAFTTAYHNGANDRFDLER